MSAPLSIDQEKRIARGAQAGALLESPIFKAAVAAVVQRYAQEAQAAKNADEGWQAILRNRALRDVVDHLRAVNVDGLAAEKEQIAAEREPSPAERIASGAAGASYVDKANAARQKFMADLMAQAKEEAASATAESAPLNGAGEGGDAA